jgi:hypothetical protein
VDHEALLGPELFLPGHHDIYSARQSLAGKFMANGTLTAHRNALL